MYVVLGSTDSSYILQGNHRPVYNPKFRSSDTEFLVLLTTIKATSSAPCAPSRLLLP